jgi:hypothetical protein
MKRKFEQKRKKLQINKKALKRVGSYKEVEPVILVQLETEIDLVFVSFVCASC